MRPYWAERNQVIQLVEDIAEYLGVLPEPGSSYQEAIDAVVTAANEPASPKRPGRGEEPANLDDVEIQILEFVAHNPSRTPFQVATAVKLSLERAKYHIQRLMDARMIELTTRDLLTGETWYGVQQRGRSLLVERGLL